MFHYAPRKNDCDVCCLTFTACHQLHIYCAFQTSGFLLLTCLVTDWTATLSMSHSLVTLFLPLSMCYFPCGQTFQPAQSITRVCHLSSFSRHSTMDAQWQQYYWNHYLLQQQQHQQLTSTAAAATHPTTSHHPYNPTGTYGPLTHALRTHHTHHTHPYTPSPQPTPSQPTPPSQPEFPPPPPHSSSHTTRHIFQKQSTARSCRHPPPHIPSPRPPTQDSWHPTDHHWDANTLHGHQLYRTIQPTQWSRKAGVAGLPTFDIFPWQLAYHGTAEYTARTLSHGTHTGFIATRSVAESVFVTHLLQEIREKRLDLDAIAETLHTTQVPRPSDQPPHPATPIPLTSTRRRHSPIPALKSTTHDLPEQNRSFTTWAIPSPPRRAPATPQALATHPTHTSPPSSLTSCNLHTPP